MFAAIAYAAEGTAQAPPSPFSAFVPFVLIFVIFYFLLIRPQQKKAKDHAAALQAMKAGDEVITSGGIIGTISRIEDDRAIVEIADKVKVAVVRSQLHPQPKKEQK